MRSLFYLCLLVLSSFSFCEKKKIIYLIRHGETNFNTDPVPRVRGRINVPLNDAGIAHCKAAGDFLANEKIGKIYYSAIPRAKQSADCVAEHHNGPVVIFLGVFMKEKLIWKLSEMKLEEISCIILKN